MEFVLDSSVALAWVIADETSVNADRILTAATPGSVFWVPALWWYEVANALTLAQRRRRLHAADWARAAELYSILPIQTDAELNVSALWRLHALAEEHNLSGYDAAYLDLTQRKGLPLASFDRALVKAARQAGVEIIP